MRHQRENRPVGDRAASKIHGSGYQDHTTIPGYQRTEPPTAEDRADAAVLAAAYERGYRLATRCIRCNQWLVAPSSVALHLGPVCRTKQAA